MKKIILIAAVIAGLCSCNSGSSNSGASTDSTANTPGVVNANGNIPDTSNGMTIQKDSKDTATKH